MKRFLSIIALAIIGCASCASTQPHMSTSHAANGIHSAPIEQQLTTVSHDAWSIVVPSGWKVNEKPEQQGDFTQVLEVKSNRNFGRGPVRFSLLTTKLSDDWQSDDMQSVMFAKMVSELVPTFFEDGKLLSRRMIVLDGRPTSLTLMQLRHGLGIAIAAEAKDGVGYVLTCGGDIMLSEERVVQACLLMFKGFHLK
jgi:hypothetical protein